ncbi:hypothetical protein IRJ41_003733 [Triplophysa rosa]|uniref:Immunoglobulin V-set domain-containing protein n=1 Tax=Triplophysa rosa TaxID=992332 RepID=A0A9W8C8N6_TRIRA|nr:hypothetical protein IRJ41_003733 [Triplophysa rosa]
MEQLRFTLTIIIYVFLFSQKRINGSEIEMKVRPGDNITLYCDCPLTCGFNNVWIRKSSYEHGPPLIIDYRIVDQESFQRFRFIDNPTNNSVDLLITNISVSDLGLYYCAEYERKLQQDENGFIYPSDVYYYGNLTTRLSLAVPSESTHPEVSELRCNCWMLLLSVCSVCVLLSSLLSAACVYCLCRTQTTGLELFSEIDKANISKVDPTERHQCEMSKTGKFCLHSEVTYRLLPSAHLYQKM